MIRSIIAIAACGLSLNQAVAAPRTWSGVGTDANWNTPANWGGTAPLNTDSIVFNGTTQPNNTNNISNLSVTGVNFNNGGFALNGNLFTNTGSANSFFTNSAGINSVNNPIFMTGPGGRYFFIAPGSELRLAGTVSNNAAAGTSVGWLNLTNGGTVRILNSCQSTRGMDLFQGTVVVDGASAVVDANNDGFRFKPPTGSTVVVQITNNGTIRIGGGGNFRMGHNGTGIGAPGAAGGSSRVDISSGLLELYGTSVNVLVGDLVSGSTAVFNHNGGLVWGSAGSGNAITLGNSAGADGTYNFNGGILWIGQVRQGNAGAANATFNFNGGTLKPSVNSTAFFQGLLNANILSGGATIDTTNLNITVGQSFAGNGSLKKTGSGTLVMTGSSSYTGSTTVSNGTLIVPSSASLGGGALVVADGAMLSVTNTGGIISASSLSLGNTLTNRLQFNFPGGTPGSATIAAGTLTANGYVAVAVTGVGLTAGTIPLLSYTSATGLPNFHLVSVPPGVSATLATGGGTVSLVVSSVGKSLAWSGAIDANWNTTTANWFDLGNGSNPTNYSQPGGFGDLVTFDDSLTANPNVNITAALSPVTMTLNNNGAVYTFTGAGKLTGIGNVVKNGFQSVTFGTVNDYSGGTVLNAGTLYVGANQALGTGPATLTLGTIASDSTSPRTLSNNFFQTVDTGVILGDTANAGTLTLSGQYDLGGGTTRTLNLNSDVNFSGSITNGAFGSKTGAGALIISGSSREAAVGSLNNGSLVVDGGTFVCQNGWRMQSLTAGATLYVIVTNNGLMRISTDVNTGNFRVGLTGGDNSANHIVDIASGTIDLTLNPPLTLAGNNAVSLGQSGANDILYLRIGGLLVTRSLFGLSPGNAEAHFLGGTIRALANEAAFISGLTNAYMENGGLTIDTTNFSVTVPQALLASGSGGLTKIGGGSLTMTGASSYTGATVVSGGKLVLGTAFASPSAITVNANSTLAFQQSSNVTVAVASVTAGSGANSAIEAQLAVTNAPAGFITNLVLNGSVLLNVTGSFGTGQFPLIGYGTISGPGSLMLGSVPLGTVGSIVTNVPNKTIDLIVSSIAKTIWKGNVSANWDTVTTNWTVSGLPVAYAQNANVLFDDSATNFSVNLTASLTPSSVIVSNMAQPYAFSGSGSLGGTMSLVKDGTNTATIGGTGNSFVGTVTVKAGKLIAGTGSALASTSGSTTVLPGATLDIYGMGLGLEPISVSGNGVGGAGAIINGGADQNDALRSLTMTGNTTIGTIGNLGLRTAADTDLGLVANGFKLVKTGGNSLNLNGGQVVAGLTNVWFTDIGDIDVQQGTLSFQRRAAMGNPTNTITVQAGATLAMFSVNTTLPEPTNKVVLNNGNFQGTGVIGDINNFGGQITLNGVSNVINVVTWVGTTGPTLLYLDGPIVGTGSVQFSASASVIRLAGNNIYTGPTVMTNGTLQLAASGALGGSQKITIQSGATLDAAGLGTWTAGTSQTLSGSGTVLGNVQANGLLAPGDTLGTLTVNGNLVIGGGLQIEVNKSLAQSNDVTVVSGALSRTGSGAIVISNLGPALTVGDKFTLFSQPLSGGGAMSVSGGGATWTNNLAVDGSISVLTVTPAGPTNAEPITVVSSGGNLTFSWPTIGWRLQVQTNSLNTGLTGSWTDWPSSTTSVTNVSVPVSAVNPTTFFRLIYP